MPKLRCKLGVISACALAGHKHPEYADIFAAFAGAKRPRTP
jgi:hypothetical protein